MNHPVKVTICAAIFLLGFSQAGLSADQRTESIRLAALDGLNGPAPCGKDNVCNIAACKQDPDCPEGMGRDTSPVSSRYPSRPDDVKDCSSTETSEIAAAIDWGAENWQEYRAVLEEIRGWPVTIGNCLEERFQRNGNVVCESSNGGFCSSKDGDNSGWASPLNQKCHLCPAFLDNIKTLPDPATNRQGCYFALLSHEWGHTCERGHKTLEIIDDEAFAYWKSKHPEVTISYSDCRMN